ncbi:MAG: hypothetical protein AVDCRST_MAG56-3459 [uncultured Cytophagales bacterium]|uniref:Uncharacterized protein n=1 Tax=uncultured Cytophagales bacterium TaxID=158755 RepID=A0A6J4JB89_9SPHI|nr:MAG: hypothetical protein AVDCRST_MAG56-3459 [uncultured Cytophagales bacterium]
MDCLINPFSMMATTKKTYLKGFKEELLVRQVMLCKWARCNKNRLKVFCMTRIGAASMPAMRTSIYLKKPGPAVL